MGPEDRILGTIMISLQVLPDLVSGGRKQFLNNNNNNNNNNALTSLTLVFPKFNGASFTAVGLAISVPFATLSLPLRNNPASPIIFKAGINDVLT
jgi:hypothetical protein